MSRRFTAVTVLLTGVVAWLVGAISAGGLSQARVTAGAGAGGDVSRLGQPTGVETYSRTLTDFADVVERVNPAVVNIEATSRPDAPAHPRPTFSKLFDPVERPEARQDDTLQRGAGSGFIIDADGSILTNHHVVDRAERIIVKLSDGRVLRARLIGADPDTDIALVKVDGQRGLPVAALGDSSSLRMGEWVCAIGNPLGYEHSVTVGVVSYLGRKLFDASLDDYIQTDAAISVGSSGGPLINARGEVVGINAAVSARTSSIGFAVPIAGATAVLPQLRAYGRVSRGYLGAAVRDLDADMRKALGTVHSYGVVVEDVTPGSPADRMAIRPYDVILSLDGTVVTGHGQFERTIAALSPGHAVALQMSRDGRVLDTSVKLAERPSRLVKAGTSRSSAAADALDQRPEERLIGLRVRELDAAAFNRYALPGSTRGLLVTQVDAASPASDADVHRGTVLLEVNRRSVTTVAEYQQVVTGVRAGDIVTLYLYAPDLRQRQLKTIRLDDRESQAPDLRRLPLIPDP